MKGAGGLKTQKDIKYYLSHFEEYIAAILFGFTGILLAIQVFSRYVLNHSFAWTEELATLLFVHMIYCGIAAGNMYQLKLSSSSCHTR